MIILKTKEEIEAMHKAGQLVASCHLEIAKLIEPGISTLEINDYVANWITKHGGKQVTKGYNGFPYETCASVNEVIAHGFPNPTPLKAGDLVKIDVVAEYEGWMGDSAWCYGVGTLAPEAQKLMDITKQCLDLGIAQALPGNRIGDVTSVIQHHAESSGFSVVEDLLGHGIGRSLHEEPNFVHKGKAGKGFRLKEGMVITIEPMINAGSHYMMIDPDDGWTASTFDGSLSAQFEHTIAITADGPLILTDQSQV